MQHDVWIPALHRDLTDGMETVQVGGDSIGAVIAQLEERFPGIENRLCEEGRMRPYIAVSVNGEISQRGVRERLTTPSEIHFIPAMSGGSHRWLTSDEFQVLVIDNC